MTGDVQVPVAANEACGDQRCFPRLVPACKSSNFAGDSDDQGFAPRSTCAVVSRSISYECVWAQQLWVSGYHGAVADAPSKERGTFLKRETRTHTHTHCCISLRYGACALYPQQSWIKATSMRTVICNCNSDITRFYAVYSFHPSFFKFSFEQEMKASVRKRIRKWL